MILATPFDQNSTRGDREPKCGVKVKMQIFNSSLVNSVFCINLKASEASVEPYLIPWMFLMA